jgi:hypothetical protein
MKRIVTWATVGLFALGLQGAALAQKEERAPEPIMPAPMESPGSMGPAEKTPATEKIQKTSKKKGTKKQDQKTSSKKPVKKKKGKPAKKVA